MPVKKQPRERPLIEMFLSAYENDAWKDASFDWIEERQDGAVEVIATKVGGMRLALEHTLIQPFVDEKFDSEVFMRAFGRIEKNADLTVPERGLTVIIPVHGIPRGYNWDEVGADLLKWLLANHRQAPKEGEALWSLPMGGRSRNEPFRLSITLRTVSLPGMAGDCLIARGAMPGNLADVVEKALRTKIPKLIEARADKRILLLERDQIALGDSEVYGEIVRLAPKFCGLAKVDELWHANTSLLASEGVADFALMDGRGLVELLSFANGILEKRRNDRAYLGPPRREF
jgi:hypothetical protein